MTYLNVNGRFVEADATPETQSSPMASLILIQVQRE
jgi:hypothetical protein